MNACCRYCRRPATGVCKYCRDIHELAWDDICHPESRYRDTDRRILDAKHPDFVEKYQTVMSWNPASDKGLTLVGVTGAGKSRISWLLMRRLHDDGLRIRAFDPASFGAGVNEHFGGGDGPAWIRGIVDGSDIVFFDDIDKGVMTPRVQAELFAVVERVTSTTGKRLVLTTNIGGGDFENLFTPSIGVPLRRRISESNSAVAFFHD